MKLLQEGARLLPPDVRNWYLCHVCDTLGGKSHPTTAEVQAAIVKVFTAVHTPILPPD
jgi:hypothetical protein